MGGCEEGSRSLTSPTMPPIARCRACTAASADGAAAAERVGSSDARDASWPALLVILVTLAAGAACASFIWSCRVGIGGGLVSGAHGTRRRRKKIQILVLLPRFSMLPRSNRHWKHLKGQ